MTRTCMEARVTSIANVTKNARVVVGLLVLAAGGAHGRAYVSQASSQCVTLPGQLVDTERLPVWRPPGDVAHGIEEFRQSVRLVLPREVSTMSVELWGGGGGGGGGSFDTFAEGGAGGGGGASGAYSRGTLAVQSGVMYTLVVGHGGRGSVGGSGTPGEDGGDSAVCAGDTGLLAATGGSGGEAARTNSHGGRGGRGHIADVVGTMAAAAVRRPGNDGMVGTTPLFEYRGRGGKGGRPVSGTIEPRGGFGGAGGAGAMRPDRPGDGRSGAPGEIIVSW
jgi:hypothetical protein